MNDDNPNPREDRILSVEEAIAAARDRLANAKSRLDKERPPSVRLPSVLDADMYDALKEESDESPV
jgi:hypothetical protein